MRTLDTAQTIRDGATIQEYYSAHLSDALRRRVSMCVPCWRSTPHSTPATSRQNDCTNPYIAKPPPLNHFVNVWFLVDADVKWSNLPDAECAYGVVTSTSTAHMMWSVIKGRVVLPKSKFSRKTTDQRSRWIQDPLLVFLYLGTVDISLSISNENENSHVFMSFFDRRRTFNLYTPNSRQDNWRSSCWW